MRAEGIYEEVGLEGCVRASWIFRTGSGLHQDGECGVRDEEVRKRLPGILASQSPDYFRRPLCGCFLWDGWRDW